MLRLAAVTAALSLAGLAFAQTYRPEFQPSQLKGPHRGTPNLLAILGTPHLSQLPPAFTPDQAKPLIDELAQWRPQEIGVEERSGLQCDLMRRFPQRYAESVRSYCWDPAPAAAATGLDEPAATAQAESLLAAWPVAPSAAQRRRLAAVFLAAADRPSAEVQWLRLSPAERHAGDGLDAGLVAELEKLRIARNETYAVAARLAAQAGLERLYAIDDHTADTPDASPSEAKAYGAAMERAWANPATAARSRADATLQAGLGQPGALLAMYRAYNAPGQGRLVFDSDFGAALEEPSPQAYGRQYLCVDAPLDARRF